MPRCPNAGWQKTCLPGRAAVAVLAILFGGCSAQIGDATGQPPGRTELPLDCTEVNPGRAPLRRLNVSEYDNTIADLLGDRSNPAARLVDEERGSSESSIVTTLLAEQYMSAAEDVASRAMGDLSSVLECDRQASGDDTCARQFIERVGPRAYRRPFRDGEVDTLFGLFTAVRDEQTFEAGVRAVLEAILQSPNFLYRVEIPATSADAIVRLDGYQMAARLSYLLWDSMPDETLFAGAAAGDFDTNEGVAEHARRMLSDVRAKDAVRRFFDDYLELERLDGLTKNADVFPAFNERIPELMRQETHAFVDEVIFAGDASWRTLMTAPWSMMNDELADYYGVSAPGGDAFVRVDLDPDFHVGLLTQGSVLASRARPYESSPIHRGMFVRGNLLCSIVPDVPEGLDVDPPDPDPSLTTRDRLAEHRSDPVCASCHAQIDPLGFAFEHFDGAGRFRMTENELPIDATGDIIDSDIDGAFDGAVELADRIVGSEEAQACFAARWFRFAYGRAEQEEDGCSMQSIRARFRESDFDMLELIVGLTQTDAFLYRSVDQGTVMAGGNP